MSMAAHTSSAVTAAPAGLDFGVRANNGRRAAAAPLVLGVVYFTSLLRPRLFFSWARSGRDPSALG
jgi:hypothetical protein